MPTIPGGARGWRRCFCACFVLVAHLALTSLAPTTARAQTETGPPVGGTATIAGAGGQAVLLRAAPGYDAAVLAPLAEGTTVDVLAGPVTGADGSTWYQVAAAGQVGYAPAGFLAAGPAPVAPPPAGDPVDPPVPAPSPPIAVAAIGEPATATTDLNLRAGPSVDAAVLLVMPAGSVVTLAGDPSNGYVPVSYNGLAGWAATAYLSSAGAPPPGSSPPPPAPGPSPGAGTATVVDSLNLRSGPSLADAVLLVMPPGSQVTVTGAAVNGFLPVTFNGTAGWAATAYLSTAGAPPPAPAPPSPTPAPPAPGPGGGTATVTSSLNLRAGPSTADAILAVMPPGATVAITGAAQNGFYPVTYAGQSGWAAGAYLAIGGAPGGDPGVPPGGSPPSGGSSGIVWPFAGGTWSVVQGYNVGSHQNRSAFAQYKYSLDFARTDGNTAGQAVYAPVSGTIRWVDRGSGGMLIDVGNGYGVAFFHVTVAGGLGSGQRVERGQYVGTISGPGGEGYAVTPHIDLTCWQFVDGGHVSVPFTGPNAIAGQEFPDIGGANQYLGFEVSV